MKDRHQRHGSECARIVYAAQLGGQRQRKERRVDRKGQETQGDKPRFMPPIHHGVRKDACQVDREPQVIQALDALAEDAKGENGKIGVSLVVTRKEHQPVWRWVECRR